jgi:hypothetical protein
MWGFFCLSMPEKKVMPMKMLKWSYTKKYNIIAVYDQFPNSPVIFRQIKDYYFVYSIKWSFVDPQITRRHLVVMEELLNIELETYNFYKKRKAFRKDIEDTGD